MDEKYINTVIGRSALWHHKISDAGFGQKPFDGFSIYKGKAIYWEAKYLPKPSSFNFHRLADHQIAALLSIEKLNTNNSFVPLFLIAVNFGRANVRIFYYTNMQEIHERKLAKKNILKKEFESSTNYITVSKGLVDLSKIIK